MLRKSLRRVARNESKRSFFLSLSLLSSSVKIVKIETIHVHSFRESKKIVLIKSSIFLTAREERKQLAKEESFYATFKPSSYALTTALLPGSSFHRSLRCQYHEVNWIRSFLIVIRSISVEGALVSKVRFNFTSTLPLVSRANSLPFFVIRIRKDYPLYYEHITLISHRVFRISNRIRVPIYFYATVSGSTATSLFPPPPLSPTSPLLSILRFPRQLGTNDDN